MMNSSPKRKGKAFGQAGVFHQKYLIIKVLAGNK
jgi:hypothetical protein